MRKRAILLFILGLVFNLLILPSIFAEEQITITTYYPSPYGSYNVLTVADRIAVGDINGDGTVDNNDLGNIFNDGGATVPLPGSLTVSKAIGIGTNEIRAPLHILNNRNLPDTGVDGVPTGGLFLESIGDAASAQFLERFNSTIFLKNSGRILNMAGTSSMKNLSLVRILDANDAILATMGGYVATPGGLDYKRAEFSGGGEVGGLYFSQNPNGNRIGLGNVYMDLNALPNFINIIGENDMISLVSFMPGDDDPNTDDTPSIRVGIGTEGPTANLHVYNDDAIDSNLNVALFESNQPAGTRIVLKNNNSIHDTDGNVIRFLDRNGGLAGSIVGARKSDDGSVQYLKLDSESAELYLDGVTGNIGIGTTAPLGALDVHSTTTAFYPPRVTTAQRNAIASTAAAEPAKEGALVYNSETNGLETYNGSGWDSAAGGGVMPGTWCGLRMQGESEPVFYCNKTYDPRFSCPSGYSKISFEEVFFSKAVYICVKN